MKKFKKTKKTKKHIKEKKKKLFSKQVVWGLGIIFLMTASVIGFQYMQGGAGEFEYNGFQFQQSKNVWITEVDGKKVYFYTLPSEVEYINMSKDALDRISGTKMLYLTFEPNQTELTYLDLARFDLTETLQRNFDIFAVSGMTTENENYNLPVVTCKNSTPFIPVIYFKSGNETTIYLKENCIIAESPTDFNFIEIRDRIMYGLSRIME